MRNSREKAFDVLEPLLKPDPIVKSTDKIECFEEFKKNSLVKLSLRWVQAMFE